MKLRVAGLVMTLALFALPAIVAAAPHTRGGFTLGLGLGGGSAGISANGNSSDRQSGTAGSFRAAYIFLPQFGVGIETNLWTKDQNGATLTFSVAAATLSYYPGASGLYLRGGVGVGTTELEAKIGSVTLSGSQDGLGVIGAGGYEWRLGRSFAIGPEIDFGYASLDGYTTNYVNGQLQFNWYFIPRE